MTIDITSVGRHFSSLVLPLSKTIDILTIPSLLFLWFALRNCLVIESVGLLSVPPVSDFDPS